MINRRITSFGTGGIRCVLPNTLTYTHARWFCIYRQTKKPCEGPSGAVSRDAFARLVLTREFVQGVSQNVILGLLLFFVLRIFVLFVLQFVVLQFQRRLVQLFFEVESVCAA